MVLGMTLPVFTAVHVALSLVGIVSGLAAILGMMRGMRLDGVTALFLVTTVLTSVTGFFFPFHGVTPGIVLGVLSLIALLGAVTARYGAKLAGAARWVWVVCAVVAEWFNVFVLIAQLFQKVRALHALAPKGSEPPFAIAQVVAMVVFIVLGMKAVKGFRPAAAEG